MYQHPNNEILTVTETVPTLHQTGLLLKERDVALPGDFTIFSYLWGLRMEPFPLFQSPPLLSCKQLHFFFLPGMQIFWKLLFSVGHNYNITVKRSP